MTVNALPGHAEMREVAHRAFLLTSGVVLHENIETFTILEIGLKMWKFQLVKKLNEF